MKRVLLNTQTPLMSSATSHTTYPYREKLPTDRTMQLRAIAASKLTFQGNKY